MPRPGAGLRGDRAVDGARRLADDPSAGRGRLADRLAGAEPPRDPHDARRRRRHPLARPAEEGPRLDPLHRRAADRAGLLRLHGRRGEAGPEAKGVAELHGHLHRRPAARPEQLRQVAERLDAEACAAIHDRGRMPRVPRQTTPPRGAGRDVRRAGHRRPLGPADGAARRHPEALCRGNGGRPGEAEQGAPGEGAGREADRLRPRREAGRAARPRPRLPGAGPRHAHALARRVAAAPAGDSGPLQPVRRRLRAGRALGGPPPVRHRGAPAGARPTEGVGQLPLRRRARPRRDQARRLDRRRRPRGRPAWRRDPLQRPSGGPRRGRGVADPALSLPGARRPRADAPRAPRLAPPGGGEPQQPPRGSTSPSRSGCSRASRASRARGSRAW